MPQGNWLPFEDAREIVRGLGLKSSADWWKWAKTKDRRRDIPAAVNVVYKDKGWVDWQDWLGYDRIKTREAPIWRSFAQARAWARSLGLTGEHGWREMGRSGQRPTDIPALPERVYKDKGWVSWTDWLGTDRRARGETWRPFAEARAFVHTLGLTSFTKWRMWIKKGNKPADIPSLPPQVYRDQWAGWDDWLGKGRWRKAPDKPWMPFEEARSIVRSLGLKSTDEYHAWAKSDQRPPDIPSAPHMAYKDDGWCGMHDWLGIVNRWDHMAILNFLRDLRPRLDGLGHMVLLDILKNQGIVDSAKHLKRSNGQLLHEIVNLTKRNNLSGLKDRIDVFLEDPTAACDGGEDAFVDVDAGIVDTIIPPHDGSGVIASEEANLPSLNACAVLEAVDYAAKQYPGKDEESIEFIITDAVGRLWRQYLHDETSIDLDQFVAHLAGEYGAQVRQRFLDQLHGACNLPLPGGYAAPFEPNMMQKLIAYRLLTEKRLGNWSGTGAGKTLAAVLASRVCDARLTVVVGLDSTVRYADRGWADQIRMAFPDSRIIIKQRGELDIDPEEHTFLLLNFESFQQPDSVEMVRRLVEKHQVDMIVLDEIQSAKQGEAMVSKRRQTLLALLYAATEENPELRVLGMSATPVINSLAEARSLLEMIQGVEFPDLETTLSMANIAAMYKVLVLFGVRAIPRYSQGLSERLIPIPGTHLIDDVRRMGKDDLLGREQAILPAKVSTIVAETVPGTLVYTHYVQGIVEPLRTALEDAGFSVGLCTGYDNTGLERFLNQDVDVLIGSDTLMQGVDGLQKVSNRLIIATLMWTGAGYDQLIGRLYRQGSSFGYVDVIIPQVVIGTEGDSWSWDEQRHDRITFKKTVADAVVDGIIPQGHLELPQSLLARSQEALEKWIARLEQEGLAPEIERPLLRVPLPPATVEQGRRHWGDFGQMNARWATSLSSTTHERLTAHPTEWFQYHSLYREARASWPEVPIDVIAQGLAVRPDWVVGDFGAGEALLATAVSNTVHSFDHVAIDERVTACDMAHTPLGDGSLDVVVFSLSLMGTNWRDYLAEAYRVLKPRGQLHLAEPCSRWEGDKREELLGALTEAGFRLLPPVVRDRFLYIDAVRT